MRRTDYILNDEFLDMVFEHMYNKRGTFGSSRTIQDEIREWKNKKYRYNDILMALEQLERDGFLNLEDNQWEGFPVYRLTYKGYLTFKSDQRGRPYQSLINETRLKNRNRKLTTIAIATNAIAILIITASQVYFDQKDSSQDNLIKTLQQELEESRIENIELKLKIKKNYPQQNLRKHGAESGIIEVDSL